MTSPHAANDFRTVLSLEPLLDFWRTIVAPRCPNMAEMFAAFEQRIAETPDLQGDISDVALAAAHTEILQPLMSVVIPSSTWDTELTGAFTPFSHDAFFSTPSYERQLLAGPDRLAGRVQLRDDLSESDHRRLWAYGLILERLYGIDQPFKGSFIRVVTDPDTGLERYYQINPDFQFVQVGTVGQARELSEAERRHLTENAGDLDLLISLLPPERFEFRGFTVVRAVDVTESEILSALERDLIDQNAIFSREGFRHLQDRLRTLFNRPGLKAGLGALQGDRVLILDAGHTSEANCLFRNSRHIPLRDLKGSIWHQAVERDDVLRIADLDSKPDRTPMEQDALDHGVRSILASPLRFGSRAIGTLFIKSDRPNDLGAADAEKIRHIAPLFSMALKRGLDDMNNEVQAIIKEKCTAVHPSVEWRFQQAAFEHMERLQRGESSEMQPIVFRDVIPLFGQSDIRGSSEARIRSIQADLTEQLNLARTIMATAAERKPWPLIDEFRFRIDNRIGRVEKELTSVEEDSTTLFLQQEVEPTFDVLRGIGPDVSRAVDIYEQALDPTTGVVYRKRKAFETSVSKLNDRLSSYLDAQQAEAQQMFPHYFEKHQTDGIDYVIYLGAAMHPEQRSNPFFLKNLALWQFIAACGLAWHTRQVQPELAVRLDTCHLILVNHSPLSIRFRYDEKRFDVDGAYDVRQEIIKSRLDKATVKGGRERLTQPGRIAVVYSQPREGENVRRHIEFLQARGHLLDDLERIDLEDLPGVRGLQAFRIGVNLEAEHVPEGLLKLAG